MDAEVIAAIIGVCGLALSVVISFLVSHLTLRYNYKQLYAEHVSDNRMEWINIWRASLSKMLACADTMHEYGKPTTVTKNSAQVNNEELLRCYEDFYENRNNVIMRLNMEEDLHRLMFAALNNLNYEKSNPKYEAQREYIIDLAHRILKPEWERVKDESKGKR